jgi:hypothetical protein
MKRNEINVLSKPDRLSGLGDPRRQQHMMMTFFLQLHPFMFFERIRNCWTRWCKLLSTVWSFFMNVIIILCASIIIP